MINNLKVVFWASLALLISASTYAQNNITGTQVKNKKNYAAVDALISDYEVFEISINKKDIKITPEKSLLTLNLENRRYELNLYDNNVSVAYKDKTLPHLLSGSLRSGGHVSLTINDDFIYGFIKTNGQALYIEPLQYLEKTAPKGLYVVYYARNVKEDKEHVCGVNETHKEEEKFAPLKTITSCKIIELGIANTFDMITKYNNNTGVQNHNLAVLNNVQTNYRSEFDANVEFDVVSHFFPTSQSNDPLQPNTTTTNASTILSNFADWAQGPGNAGGGNTGGATGGFGIDFNMGMLWTDRNIAFNGSSGTVGLAYTPGWFHLLEDYTTSAPSLAAMTTHEVGHNLSAQHDASGSNFIMAPSVTLTDIWSTTSKNAINSRLNTQTYLNNCSTIGPPVAGFTQSGQAICVGSTVEFEEQSQYGATRVWDFFNGAPLTSLDEKPTSTFNTPGLHAIKLTSTNAAGSDIEFGYVDVQTAPPSPCSPSSGTGGSGGITSVSLSNMSSSSTTAGVYSDFSCSNVATLLPSNSYNFVIGVFGVTRLRYFIDYNNDGDFTDGGEAANQVNFSGNGNLGLTLNVPAGPMSGELLRMRIIVSTTTIGATGCTTPGTGQVEDYSVYIEEPQIFGCTDPSSANFNPAATIDDGSCGTTPPPLTWYEDSDGDTYGDPLSTTTSVTQPTGYVVDNTDCNDTDGTVFPGATELCDGQINNCDTSTLPTDEVDNDGDGFVECTLDSGGWDGPNSSIQGDDCDDTDANNFPDNIEICDGQDNNCDGQIDENGTNVFYADTDGDTYGDAGNSIQACFAPTGYVTNNTDCDDTNAAINPAATEICDNQDNNCNGVEDEGVLITFYIDSDGDGYGNNAMSTQACATPSGYVNDNTDCDDTNAAINPAATEIPNNGIDEDCDGADGITDNDNDGFSPPQDCDDNNAAINPAATEVCDGVDNNCDGQIDEGVQTTFFVDSDGDGFGDSNASILACTVPTGYVTTDTDCDDNDANNYPGNTEVCDGQDNDCDGMIDEGCSSGATCDGNFLVINTLTQNIYRANISIQSTATIDNSGTNVLFTAGNEIELKPGFEVILGTDFEARIEPCSTLTSPDDPNNSRIQLGDLNDQIIVAFGENLELNVTLIDINNIIVVEKALSCKDVKQFILDNAFNLHKGTYRIIINDFYSEIIQDVIVLK